jgi:hypothetical protein
VEYVPAGERGALGGEGVTSGLLVAQPGGDLLERRFSSARSMSAAW